MEILSKKRTARYPTRRGMFEQTLEFLKVLDTVKKGQSVKIKIEEWPVMTNPSSSYINTRLKTLGIKKEFSMRTLKNKEGYLFIRVS